MSYDITLFVEATGFEGIHGFSAWMNEELGLSLKRSDLDAKGYECRLLGLIIELQPRAGFLQNTKEATFTDFDYQVEIGGSGAASDLVHPLAWSMAKVVSKILQSKTMLCLNGVEFVGALFQSGEVERDGMSRLDALFRSSTWRYSDR